MKVLSLELANFKNPIIIDYLYKTAEIKFKYLEYEEDYLELSRKCILELCKINTSESIEKIRLLAKSSDPIVAKYALDRLAGKN